MDRQVFKWPLPCPATHTQTQGGSSPNVSLLVLPLSSPKQPAAVLICSNVCFVQDLSYTSRYALGQPVSMLPWFRISYYKAEEENRRGLVVRGRGLNPFLLMTNELFQRQVFGTEGLCQALRGSCPSYTISMWDWVFSASNSVKSTKKNNPSSSNFALPPPKLDNTGAEAPGIGSPLPRIVSCSPAARQG